MKFKWKHLKKLFMLSDKKALSRSGHKWFAIMLGFFVIYILKDYLPISYPFILLHVPFYLGGAVFPDVIHRTGRGRIIHRSGIFHLRLTYQILAFASPVIIYYAVISPKVYFMSVPFNQFTLIQAIILGILTHGISDNWTSPLRRKLF